MNRKHQLTSPTFTKATYSTMPSLKDSYLILYNAACIGGWAYVLYLFTVHVINQAPCCLPSLLESFSQVYHSTPELSKALVIVQTAAIMEIVHAATGLVRSPAAVTAMQVSSRLVALFAIVFSPFAQNHYGAGLMILGWSLVEVPRYAFYVAALISGDATKGTPYPLFYLRYSLFFVLYPLGISGELLTFKNAISDNAFLSAFTGMSSILYNTYYFIILTYIPGGPFMYMNMVWNRANAMKKRFARPKPPPRGLVFPKGKKGDSSTSEAGVAALAAAVSAVDVEAGNKIAKSKNWRFG